MSGLWPGATVGTLPDFARAVEGLVGQSCRWNSPRASLRTAINRELTRLGKWPDLFRFPYICTQAGNTRLPPSVFLPPAVRLIYRSDEDSLAIFFT